MPSLDGTLNVVGTSMEFVSVVVGGINLPYAKQLRAWVRGFLSSLLLWIAFILFVGMGFAGSITFIVLQFLDISTTEFVERVYGDYRNYPIMLSVIIGVNVGAFALFKGSEWIEGLGDEALRNFLLAMGAFFGIGVLLQLIAAATP